jgi:hypothetical protein
MEKAKIEVTTNGATTTVKIAGENARELEFHGGTSLSLAADIASIAGEDGSVTVEGEGAAEIVAELSRRGIEAEVIETAEEPAPAE